jgi:excisionase family DNA binding protein
MSETQDDASDTMSLEELARRIGISLTVAYELAKKNKLPIPAIRVGRQYRFSRRAYDALMDAQHPPDA